MPPTENEAESSGVDVMLDRHVDSAAIRHALTDALGLPIDRVATIPGERIPPRTELDALCQLTIREGQFPTHVSVDTTPPILSTHRSRVRLLRELARRFQCVGVIPRDDPNPHLVWVVADGGAPYPGALDPDEEEDAQLDWLVLMVTICEGGLSVIVREDAGRAHSGQVVVCVETGDEYRIHLLFPVSTIPVVTNTFALSLVPERPPSRAMEKGMRLTSIA